MRFSIAVISALLTVKCWTEAFTFVPKASSSFLSTSTTACGRNLIFQPPLLVRKGECVSRDGKDPSEDDDDDSQDKSNYPYDLEFIDYDDPNYSVDQGIMEGEEFYNSANASWEEGEVEAMREERRKQNDLFQFNIYYKKFLQEKEWKGIWTEYKTSTFMEDIADKNRVSANGIPKLAKGKSPLQVVSTGSKDMVEPWGPDNEIIVHNEIDQVTNKEKHVFCPPLRKFDFRGHQGNMCVGNAYSVCDSVRLLDDVDSDKEHTGPFSELRMEVGIMYEEVRMRLKLDYSVMDDERVLSDTPALRLRNVIVCRERLGAFPCSDEQVFFGEAGAPGGLYDPPPIGNEEQQYQYMYLSLEGGASALFPHSIEQDASLFDGKGWVVSLDWTPGKIRYQVDRKFLAGTQIKGLKTLELSEVQGEDASDWKPNSGPEDMRQ